MAAASTGTAWTAPPSSDAGRVPSSGPGLALTAGIWDDGLNYGFFRDYLAAHTQILGDPGFSISEYDASQREFVGRTPRTALDVALVLDTTGSMGDELSYLTTEFAAISDTIRSRFPNSDQRWALVVYRDTPDTDPGDEYVVRTFEFTSDMTAFGITVAAQRASGGGDYPESPELGIAQLAQLTWRADPTAARLAFWVADAPHHATNAGAMKRAIVSAHAASIHLYPVSASGANDLLELTMRSAAQITGGRYIFLTDDSGIGDPHKQPEIPCYYVTRLAAVLPRVAAMELSGAYVGPDAGDVLRIAGEASPGGTCVLPADGGTAQLF